MPEMTPDAFIRAVYETAVPHYLVTEHIDDLLKAGKFAEIDAILGKLDRGRIPRITGWTLLGITYPCRDKLENWESFRIAVTEPSP